MAINVAVSAPVIPTAVIIITAILCALLLCTLISCIIAIVWRAIKDREKRTVNGVDQPPSYSRSTTNKGYVQVATQSFQSDDQVTYASLQRRMDQSFAQIKELEDRIDLETSEECQVYYNLQDGLDKARSRLDVIEYTIKSNQSNATNGTSTRRQESTFSRSSQGTMNSSFRYADMNQTRSSRSGQPAANYQAASFSSYGGRQTSIAR